MNEYPDDFCPETYRTLHADLVNFDNEALRKHYGRYGKKEGRQASVVRGRRDFLNLFKKKRPALEIGAFDRSLLDGPDVYHFDVLDQQELKYRAKKLGRDSDAVPYIDYISSTGDLSSIDRTFELVISSHSIEHTPDFIANIKSVTNILTPTGVYALMIPDCRYCFDHYIPPSSIAEVLQANIEARKVHTLASIVEHRALTTHNDPARHWAGDHGPKVGLDASRIMSAISEWKAANGRYVDVHAWQFTPESFNLLITLLVEIDQISLRPLRIYQPVRGANEFLVILSRVS